MKMCSISYVSRELQIKTTTRYHYSSVRRLKCKILTVTNASKNGKQQELSFFAGKGAKWYVKSLAVF